MSKSLSLKLILVTPVFFLIAHYLAVFPHEYAHSFMAWLLGFKPNPLAIDYGGTSWINLFLLSHIDENVNYDLIMSQGHSFSVALIAFAGAGIANVLLYLLSLVLLARKNIQQRPFWFYFIFWFNFINLANFYDYVPIRTFSTHGDMAHVATGLGISPWPIYIIAGYLVAFVIWHFFTDTLVRAFICLKLSATFARASLMMVCVLILFGYFGMAGFVDYGEISHFLSATSFILIPGVIIACWPTRLWVKRQDEKLRSQVS
jgi:hypothetical protein